MAPSTNEDAGEEKKEECPTSPERPHVNEILKTSPVAPTIPTVVTDHRPSFRRPQRRFFLSLFSLGAHSILFLCFLALAVSYCVQTIHDDYFVPVVERARRTDEDLLEEITYYQRECNAMDITAGVEDAQDLFIRSNSTNYGVDQMMTHGSVLFPDLLSPDTVTELRKFIVAKNAVVEGTPAQYPVSQGYRRLSYGIDATEDPAVIRALKEIHDNVQLEHLLEGLLGKNPALTEITAITARYGCEPQAWHPDVKPDGNAVMFGRTYSHSYSLFIPLQDTTAEMGATDLCPGTHYCAGSDLYALCEREKIGMHQVSGQGYWPAGSAALLNQQVWHRGTAHDDEDADERVVFIVSFLARPNDTRQLSRGTYFHMKWNMWGHTWADLDDSLRFMSWPWNILTCLHIWRPAKNGWGYDLITAAAMRIANYQLGCAPEDLEKFLDVLDRAGFPAWLDGTIDRTETMRGRFTFEKPLPTHGNFCGGLNIKVSMIYVVSVLLLSVAELGRGKSGLRVLWESTKSVLWTHGTVVALAFYVLAYVREQSYAKDITEGRMLMRPFPPLPSTLLEDPAVPQGRSTMPTRQDVLFGGRLDAKTIGAYNRWLEFHPGNQLFQMSAEANGGASLYRSYYNNLPPVFTRALLDAIMEPILREGGRILCQDYQTGDWLHPELEFTDAMVQKTVFVGREGPLYELQQEYQFVLGNARFGYTRQTSMARYSLGFLHDLESSLFGRFVLGSTTSTQKSGRLIPVFRAPAFSSVGTKKPLAGTLYPRRDWMARWTTNPLKQAAFAVGEEVFISNSQYPDSRGYLVTVAHVDEQAKTVDVAIYSGDIHKFRGVIKTVPWSSVKKLPALYEGSPVWANFENGGEYFPGRIILIRPTGEADIDYDDGSFEPRVPMDMYSPMK